MKRLLREFRLVPVVLVAIGCLFVLKIVGLVADGGYTLGGMNAPPINFASPKTVKVSSPSVALADPATDPNKQSWAREMFNFPDITGAVSKPAPKDAAAGKDPPAQEQPTVPQTVPAKGGTVVPLDNSRTLSASERAILERLQERRTELDARARELEVRESLLKAAEKRIEARVNEIKETEARISGAVQKKDEAEATRFKALVTMYENMKAKDAARIFDRLDLKILVDVTNQLNPRRMADILAQMTSEAAEKLTVELASRASGDKAPLAAGDLPKIEGRPGGG
jgi:flagellar motility protein MotE (MotC chaperone)